MGGDYLSFDFDEIIMQNRQIILEGIFGVSSPIQVGSSMAFAKYLGHVGITSRNYLLFLKIIETNNKWVVDELLEDRDPRLLFSSIRPNAYLIRHALELISSWHPGQIYEKVLLAVLGTVEYTYHKPDTGYDIYPIEVADLQNIGKFLDEDKDQLDATNSLILEIFDRMTKLGQMDYTPHKAGISRLAFNMRDAFFDNTKSLKDTIPEVLLVRLNRESREVRPAEDFFDFAGKISNN